MATSTLLRWLEAVALLHVAGGLLVAAIGLFDLPFADAYWRHLLAATRAPPEAEALARGTVSLIGPTVAAWGLALFVGLQVLRTRPSRRQVALLAASVLVWLVPDLALSTCYGFLWHWPLDLAAALALLLPLALLWRRWPGHS